LTVFIGLAAASFIGQELPRPVDAARPRFKANRFNQPAEELGIQPDQISSDSSGLLGFGLSGAPAGAR
jgi:hypothetical protein